MTTSRTIPYYDYDETIVGIKTEINLIPDVTNHSKASVYKYDIDAFSNKSSFYVNREELNIQATNSEIGNVEVNEIMESNIGHINVSTIQPRPLLASNPISGKNDRFAFTVFSI